VKNTTHNDCQAIIFNKSHAGIRLLSCICNLQHKKTGMEVFSPFRISLINVLASISISDHPANQALTTKDMKISNNAEAKPQKAATFPSFCYSILSFFEALPNSV
jgi:hypothetical protein